MTTLHLGVSDVPYSVLETPAQRRARTRKGKKHSASANKTTGDVAEILEAKYHVFATFYELHAPEIVAAFEESVMDAMESQLSGAPMGLNATGAAEAAVSDLFQKFIENKEMDRLGIKGVPTQASLDGVSHRFKNKRGQPGRPSFVDTGLYVGSFRAWID